MARSAANGRTADLSGSLPVSLPGAPAVVIAHLLPAVVLGEDESAALIAAARTGTRDTVFSVGRGGLQMWSHSVEGAVHLGSVDWAYDTPVRHHLTLYRVGVTAAGHTRGCTTSDLVAMTLDLAGIPSTPSPGGAGGRWAEARRGTLGETAEVVPRRPVGETLRRRLADRLLG